MLSLILFRKFPFYFFVHDPIWILSSLRLSLSVVIENHFNPATEYATEYWMTAHTLGHLNCENYPIIMVFNVAYIRSIIENFYSIQS